VLLDGAQQPVGPLALLVLGVELEALAEVVDAHVHLGQLVVGMPADLVGLQVLRLKLDGLARLCYHFKMVVHLIANLGLADVQVVRHLRQVQRGLQLVLGHPPVPAPRRLLGRLDSFGAQLCSLIAVT